MKKNKKIVVLPSLPIVGNLEVTTIDGKSLSSINVTTKRADKIDDPFFKHCHEEFKEFLSGKKKNINIKLDMTELTDFQKEVLKVMKKVPYGKVTTYKELADKLDSRAFQAIGGACGRNPFMLIYPCHRVLASNGIGGFAHGLKMKKDLLELEAKNL